MFIIIAFIRNVKNNLVKNVDLNNSLSANSLQTLFANAD